MALTAGVISLVSKDSTSDKLSATPATGGTGPYTYQWYRSQTPGFTPGGGNIIAGATALSLSDSGLIPNSGYYYKVVATDTGHSNDTVIYTQLLVTTNAASQNPNQFAQTPLLGMIDLRFDPDTVSVQIDATQVGALYAGSAVKMVDSADGIPKVVGCTADSDEVLGFINYDIKSKAFLASDRAEISMSDNVMFLYSTGPIARGAPVTLDVASPGSVAQKVTSSGATIVGWAYDKAPTYGSLIRVFLTTPSFQRA